MKKIALSYHPAEKQRGAGEGKVHQDGRGDLGCQEVPAGHDAQLSRTISGVWEDSRLISGGRPSIGYFRDRGCGKRHDIPGCGLYFGSTEAHHAKGAHAAGNLRCSEGGGGAKFLGHIGHLPEVPGRCTGDDGDAAHLVVEVSEDFGCGLEWCGELPADGLHVPADGEELHLQLLENIFRRFEALAEIRIVDGHADQCIGGIGIAVTCVMLVWHILYY